MAGVGALGFFCVDGFGVDLAAAFVGFFLLGVAAAGAAAAALPVAGAFFLGEEAAFFLRFFSCASSLNRLRSTETETD